MVKEQFPFKSEEYPVAVIPAPVAVIPAQILMGQAATREMEKPLTSRKKWLSFVQWLTPGGIERETVNLCTH